MSTVASITTSASNMCRHLSNVIRTAIDNSPIAAYYSFIYPERMKGCILLWYSCFISLCLLFLIVAATLSAYIVLKSGKPQPIRSPYQNRYTCTAQGPTTFTKFWTGSDKWRQNGGLGRVPKHRVFL